MKNHGEASFFPQIILARQRDFEIMYTAKQEQFPEPEVTLILPPMWSGQAPSEAQSKDPGALFLSRVRRLWLHSRQRFLCLSMFLYLGAYMYNS